MRFVLSFELPNCELPTDYARLMVGFFKKAVKAYDEDSSQRLFGAGCHQPKSYSFSLYLPGVTYKGETAELKGNQFDMIFSTNSMQDSLLFYNAFLMQKDKQHHSNGKYQFTLRKLTVLRETKVKQNQCLIKFLSPLLVMQQEETGFKRCYDVTDEKFNEKLKEVIQYQINTLAPHLNLNQFSLTPLQTKCITTRAYQCYLKAHTGIFQLTGSPELIQFLLDGGMGNCRGSGYGLFKMV